MRLRLAAPLAVAIAAATTASAGTPSASPGTPSGALVAEGDRRLADRDFAAAVVAYETALVLGAGPETLLGLARAWLGDGRCEEAAAALARHAVACPGCAPELRSAVGAEIRTVCEAWATIDALGHEVILDGEAKGASGRDHILWPGPHVVEAVGPGGERYRRAFCLSPAERTRVALDAADRWTATTPKSAAAAHEQAAIRHLRVQAYCPARQELEAAYRAMPIPEIVFNMGLVEAEWPGRCGDAMRSFERYLQICTECSEAAAAAERLARLNKTCRAETTIEVDAEGAIVEVDGRRIGPSPQVLNLIPGRHIARARLGGQPIAERWFDVRLGVSSRLRLRPVDLAEAPAARPTPLPTVVAIEPGVPVGPALLLAAGGALAVVGAAFAGLAVGDGREAETLAAVADPRSGVPRRAELEALYDRRDRNAGLAAAGLGLGVLGAIGGIVWWALADGPAPVGGNARGPSLEAGF